MRHIRFLVLTAFLFCTLSVSAREVDNYLAWGVDLADSGEQIDKYMRERIAAAMALEKVSAREIPPSVTLPEDDEEADEWYLSCFGSVERMMKEAFFQFTYQKIEQFVDEGNGLDIYPRRPSTEDEAERRRLGETPENGYMTNDEYIEQSIVRTSPVNTPLSRIININGIYIGSDKLGHFTSFGQRYYRKYLKQLKQGKSRREAFDAVMQMGYGSEESVVGMMFTKVFSRGDLEANYQGAEFTESLCERDSEVRMVFNGERWEIQNLDKLTIVPYINPHWDESYHASIFTDKKWEEAVVPAFEERNLCDQLDTGWVKRQRAYYDSIAAKSLNTWHGDTWIPENLEGKDPDVHSLDRYCEEQILAPVSPPSSGNPLPARDDEWRYSLAFPMLWAPDFQGKVRGDESVDFEASFSDVLDDLSFAFLFEFYANRGPFGLSARTNFLSLEDEAATSGTLDAEIGAEMNMSLSDFTASWRVHDKLRVVTGARHVYTQLDLELKASLGDEPLGKSSIEIMDDHAWDWIVGLSADHWVNEKWGFLVNADVGLAGDNDRDYSIDARAIYRFSDLNNIWFGWRHLDIETESGSGSERYLVDLTMTGPMLGWAFTF